MRKLLRWLLNFIETRFPEKVMLNIETFNRFQRRIEFLERKISELNNAEVHRSVNLENIEKSIAALKEGIVKGEIRPSAAIRDLDRQAFIDGNLQIRGMTRNALEKAIP